MEFNFTHFPIYQGLLELESKSQEFYARLVLCIIDELPPKIIQDREGTCPPKQLNGFIGLWSS